MLENGKEVDWSLIPHTITNTGHSRLIMCPSHILSVERKLCIHGNIEGKFIQKIVHNILSYNKGRVRSIDSFIFSCYYPVQSTKSISEFQITRATSYTNLFDHLISFIIQFIGPTQIPFLSSSFSVGVRPSVKIQINK